MGAEETPDEGSSQAETASDGDTGSAGSKEKDGISITRRQAIAGGGVLAVLGMGIGVLHVLRPAEGILPTVPEENLEANDWVKIDQTSETPLDDSAGPVNVEAVAATVQYENEGLTRDIKDTEVKIEYRGETITERLGDHLGSEFDQSMGVFAATKIDVTPHIDELPGGIGRAEVMDPVLTQAQDKFEAQLQDAGLGNVRHVDTSDFEIDTGQMASFFEYRAAFVFEQTEVTLRGTTIEIPGGEIDVAGYLAVWHNGRNVLIAAGAHPNENYADTITETVQGDKLTLSFDLELSPSSLRDEVLGYMRRVK